MKRTILLLSVCLISVGCSSGNHNGGAEDSVLPANMPDDFDFVYQYGYDANHELNTFDDLYTKNLIDDGEVSTVLVINDRDKEEIYKKMRESNILETPDELTREAVDGTQCSSNPYTTHMLDIKANGGEHSVSWTTNNCLTDELMELIEFTNYLHEDVIMSHEAYRALPEAEGAYE
ncbi:hypothetical protein [Alkalibacillus haloalkaliphilus]|uniref:hypothetical protein n=1 Tax=Alkalibacillus haloalkaliphilus TaxID=94136 RepID=UPI0029363DB0|nr:hypothetical protein [Alkalibacillus haloalkaliphilus]MDV2582925.1 hypothetical protein [Alkalibacillus haloalkaliphilus]